MGHRPCHILLAMEREALEELQKDNSIVIVPADKGRAIVIMDKSEYGHKARSLHDDSNAYKVVTKDQMTSIKISLIRY